MKNDLACRSLKVKVRVTFGRITINPKNQLNHSSDNFALRIAAETEMACALTVGAESLA
jgi:hypothetical protein